MQYRKGIAHSANQETYCSTGTTGFYPRSLPILHHTSTKQQLEQFEESAEDAVLAKSVLFLQKPSVRVLKSLQKISQISLAKQNRAE